MTSTRGISDTVDLWYNWGWLFHEASGSSYLPRPVFPVWFDSVSPFNKAICRREWVKLKSAHMNFLCLFFLFVFSLQDQFYLWQHQIPPSSDGVTHALHPCNSLAHFLHLAPVPEVALRCHSQLQKDKRITEKSCRLMLLKRQSLSNIGLKLRWETDLLWVCR